MSYSNMLRKLSYGILRQCGYARQSEQVPVLAKLRIVKTFIWPTAALSKQTNCHEKWTISFFSFSLS